MSEDRLRIAYRGNFRPSWSTENHVASSMELLGHEVMRCQEDDLAWDQQIKVVEEYGARVFWWTQTYGYALKWDQKEALEAVEELNKRVVTVSYHLDKWWGLAREADLTPEYPFFRTRHVYTADGDHDERFMSIGVNHRWSPPAVYSPEAVPGTPQRRWNVDIAFLGTVRGYHTEWNHRQELVQALSRRYRSHFRTFPRPGQHAFRGQALNDLLASVKVVVGDSLCLGCEKYVSDRLYETIGRGGFMIFPNIKGLDDHYLDRTVVPTYEFGDFSGLFSMIDHYLRVPKEREMLRELGGKWVRDNHTYEHRVQKILAEVI